MTPEELKATCQAAVAETQAKKKNLDDQYVDTCVAEKLKVLEALAQADADYESKMKAIDEEAKKPLAERYPGMTDEQITAKLKASKEERDRHMQELAEKETEEEDAEIEAKLRESESKMDPALLQRVREACEKAEAAWKASRQQ